SSSCPPCSGRCTDGTRRRGTSSRVGCWRWCCSSAVRGSATTTRGVADVGALAAWRHRRATARVAEVRCLAWSCPVSSLLRKWRGDMSWQPILLRDDNYPVPPVVISHDGEWTWKHISVGNEAGVEWQHYRSGDRIAWYGSKSGLWAGISEGL